MYYVVHAFAGEAEGGETFERQQSGICTEPHMNAPISLPPVYASYPLI